MTFNDNRPVFLNLLKIRLPVPGIMSIIHRVSGFFLYLLLLPAIWVFQQSLESEASFQQMTALFNLSIVQFFRILFFWLVCHHLLAGIRYLLLDIDIGIERHQFRKSAVVVMILSPICALLLEWFI